MEPRRPRLLDAGLALVVIGTPLVFSPMSRAPFVDPKLLVLAAGVALVWASGVGWHGRLAAAAGAWVVVLAVAALAGVDPAASLIGSQGQGTGLILYAAAALLLVVGPRIPRTAVERVPGWLVRTGAAVAVVLVAFRVAPGAFEAIHPDLSFGGSTLGNPVFAAGMLAVAVAAVAATETDLRRAVAWTAVLGLGLAAVGERSALLLPAAGLAIALWRSRAPARRAVVVVATLLVTLLGWAAIDGLLPDPTAARTASQLRTLAAERARLAVWSADLRGFSRRPFLGWGPGTTWSAYVSSGTEAELDRAGRGWGDAHDLPLELLVTTGTIGLAIFSVLAVLAIVPAAGAPPDLGWALGGAAALALFHLGEPVNVALTPLLFLLVGVAAGPRSAPRARGRTADRTPVARLARGAVGAGLGLALAATLLVFVASTVEQWGRSYFAPWALRTSMGIAPWRSSAAEALAIERAIDGRGGDEEADREARALAAGIVRTHPWGPGVRIAAADVHALLRDPEGAERWIREHLERFPNDPLAREAASVEPTQG